MLALIGGRREGDGHVANISSLQKMAGSHQARTGNARQGKAREGGGSVMR